MVVIPGFDEELKKRIKRKENETYVLKLVRKTLNRDVFCVDENGNDPELEKLYEELLIVGEDKVVEYLKKEYDFSSS